MRHSTRLNLKDFVLKDYVLLVKNALRKVSNSLDIYVQTKYSPYTLQVLGRIKDQVNDFQANTQLQLIKTIPSDTLLRHIIKVTILYYLLRCVATSPT